MAKNKKSARRGRPPAAVPLSVRILVRLDKPAGDALAKYSETSGIKSISTGARVLIVSALNRAGLL